MAGDSPKPSIPAWQQAQQSHIQAQTPKAGDDGARRTDAVMAEPTPKQEESSAEASIDTVGEEEQAPPSEGTSQLEMVETFLADPTVQEATLEKKRAFLESKAIPVETIDKVLPSPDKPIFEPKEFLQSFQQQQQQQKAPVATAQASSQPSNAPPIITYPEFLVDAHKPPPLITPGRILSAAYIASGATALLYGAGKYIVSPMISTLTESRHDFASHSQIKLDEFNERLSKIVGVVPERRRDAKPVADAENNDVESITSDPTELYHRDMGTQTSPALSRESSSDDLTATIAQPPKRNQVAYETNGLSIMKEHLSELLLGADKQEACNKERQDSVNKLRHYLDTVMYGSPNISMWSTSEEAMVGKEKRKDDAVEELKKEIRGVKGVLLSARRFPTVGAGGRAGGT